MLRYLTVVLALTALVTAENHKVFRITPESEDQLKVLRSLDKHDDSGYNYWKDPSVVQRDADLMVAPEKLDEFVEFMRSNDIKFKPLIENVETLLHNEITNRTYTRSLFQSGFDWRSYHNLEEIYSWLDTLAQQYPENVEIIIGGQSYEGRQIKGVKLSFGSNKPGVFIEGGIHAREWISHATVTYLINQFLTSKDPTIRQLAEAHDWYIFPVFNPDGYAYTHVNQMVAQYRFWRKTRSPGSDVFGCKGADMNRNWGYQWMTVGASQYQCSEAYAGSSAFSEIETRTLSKYISSISDKLFAYVAFHSYSQFLMFPYGHSKEHLDNYDEHLAIGKKAIQSLSRRYGTLYKTGSIGELIGYASGGSVDWVKAKLKLPLVFVYELRDKGDNGFVLPPNQIIPTGEETLDSLVTIFSEAKKFGYP